MLLSYSSEIPLLWILNLVLYPIFWLGCLNFCWFTSYILDISPLSDVVLIKICSQYVGCQCVLLTISFGLEKLSSFMRYHLSILFFKFYVFIYWHSIFYPPPSTLWLFPFLLPIALSPCRCLHLPPHLTSKLPGTQVSWGLSVSSLNEHRPRSPLLYVYWGPHITWHILPVWWFSVWGISGGQNNWDCWSSYKVTLLLSFF